MTRMVLALLKCARDDKLRSLEMRHFASVPAARWAYLTPGQAFRPGQRQYRYIGDAFPWEMPTGNIAAGESPEEAANRELAEEAGCRAAHLQPLGHFHTSKAHCDEIAYLFVGLALTPAQAEPDETEEVERGLLPFDEVLILQRDIDLRLQSHGKRRTLRDVEIDTHPTLSTQRARVKRNRWDKQVFRCP